MPASDNITNGHTTLNILNSVDKAIFSRVKHREPAHFKQRKKIS